MFGRTDSHPFGWELLKMQNEASLRAQLLFQLILRRLPGCARLHVYSLSRSDRTSCHAAERAMSCVAVP